jgi:hypothetical protein
VTKPDAQGKDSRVIALWTAFLAGPLAWSFNQGAGYALMKPVCAGKAAPVLWLVAIASLCLVVAGSCTAWGAMRPLLETARDDGGEIVDRDHFVAVLALALNVLIALLIVTSVIPQFFLSPCE